MNINQELFKRYSPAKKYSIVSNLTTSELFQTTSATILRILKEVGTGDKSKVRNTFKSLYFNNRVSNKWNSSVRSLWNGKKGILYIDVYIQGDDTDTEVTCELSKVLNSSNYDIELGRFEESYLHGNSRLIHANYSKEDRAAIIREILLTYIQDKYNFVPTN